MNLSELRKSLEDMTEYLFSDYAIELSNTDNLRIPEDHLFPSSIAIEYRTGGNDGGNCWGGEAKPYYLNEDELPNIQDELIIPIMLKCGEYFNFSFAKGMEFMQKLTKLIKTETRSRYEYYGNSTDYKIKYILINDIIQLFE